MIRTPPVEPTADPRLIRAFDDCLARIEAGATAEAALARWPELEGQLAPLVGHAVEIRALLSGVDAPTALVADLERRADEALDAREAWWRRLTPTRIALALGQGLGRRPDARPGPVLAPTSPQRVGRSPRLTLAVLALAATAVLAGGIALAAASRPGDRLHPLKPAADRMLGAIGFGADGGPSADLPSAEDPPSGPAGAVEGAGAGAAAGTRTAVVVRATPAGGASSDVGLPDRIARSPATTARDRDGWSRQSASTATARARSGTALGARSTRTPAPAPPAADPRQSQSPTIPPTTPPTPAEPPASPTEPGDRPAPPGPTNTPTARPSQTPTSRPVPTDTPTHAPTTALPIHTATATPEPRPETGGISGTVEYKDEEAPAPGIEVVARQIVSDPEAPPFTLGDTRVTESDDEGRFAFHDLRAGHWVVGAGDPRVWWETSEAPERANPIAVAAGEVRDGIRLRIARP